MSRLRAVAAALTLGVPFAATAADITRVASSFEDDDPFGLFVDVSLEHTQRHTKILKDGFSGDTRQLVPKLQYGQYSTQLNVDVAAGISRDVEFSFGMPVVLFRYERMRPVDRPNDNITDIVDGPRSAYRAGLGNAHFGLAWAIFNQKKDDTKPMWVVRVEYEAPTAPRLDPRQKTAGENSEGWSQVGDQVHKYTLSTALSREIGVAEPYFKAYYTIPVRGPRAYSNCETKAPEYALERPFMGKVSNCDNSDDWVRQEVGIKPPHQMGVLFGSEFEIYNSNRRKLDLDVRAIGNYVGAGRYYNELSVPMQKFLATGDYLQFGGRLALKASVFSFLSVRASGQFLYNTDHVLTNEEPNRKWNGEQVGVEGTPENPNYVKDFDGAGNRFYASQSKDLRFDVTAILTF